MRSVVCRRPSCNREEGSYVASRNTKVEATSVVTQEPREREPIKKKSAGGRIVPPCIFVPGEGRRGRSPYSLAPRRKKAGRTRIERTLAGGSNIRRAVRRRQGASRRVKERKILREGVCEATAIQLVKFSAKESLYLRICLYRR
jgi:hypothetical protein